jgi:hypothetical protein
VALTYDQWQEGFEEEFFAGRYVGRPFWFYVDDDVVNAVAAASGEASGLRELERLGHSYAGGGAGGIFSGNVQQRCRAWSSGPRTSPPPVLPVLALTVLAATQMQSADGVSQANYYRRLRALLDLPAGAGEPRGFSDNVVPFWRLLRDWAQQNEGRIGRLLIPADPRPAYVGFPISQAVWRQADSDHLARLLWEEHGEVLLGAGPRDIEASARNLVVDRELLPARARRVFVDESLADVRERVLADITELPPPPETEAGQAVRARRVEIILRGTAGPRLNPTFVIPRDPRWPATVQAVTGTGAPVSAVAPPHVPGYYLLDGIFVDDRSLTEGFSLVSEYGRWVFEASEFVVLAAHPELGLATTRLGPDERAVLLARANDVGLAPRIRPAADPSLPAGWVRYDNLDAEDLPAQVADAVDAARYEVLDLVGGLSIRPRTYLSSSLPDLRLPEALAKAPIVEIDVDGVPTRMRNEGGAVRLPPGALDEGRHRLRLGTAAASLVVTHGLSPACEYDLDNSVELATGRVAGAHLDPVPPPPSPRPIVVSGRASEIFLLGASVGEVEVHGQQRPPAWLDLTPIAAQQVEIRPSFPVVWAIEIGARGARCRLVQWLEPRSGGQVDPRWTAAVQRHVANCHEDSDLVQAYLDVAVAVQR